MKVSIRKLAKIKTILKTLTWLFIYVSVAFGVFRGYINIKKDLESIKALQVIQLEFAKRFCKGGLRWMI